MALISSGFGIGVAVGIDVEVDVGEGAKDGAGVNIWVDGAVGDGGGEAKFVPTQAERLNNIHTILTNFDLFMVE
jgi:hypothetical protein